MTGCLAQPAPPEPRSRPWPLNLGLITAPFRQGREATAPSEGAFGRRAFALCSRGSIVGSRKSIDTCLSLSLTVSGAFLIKKPIRTNRESCAERCLVSHFTVWSFYFLMPGRHRGGCQEPLNVTFCLCISHSFFILHMVRRAVTGCKRMPA